jgi:hypothetical protein
LALKIENIDLAPSVCHPSTSWASCNIYKPVNKILNTIMQPQNKLNFLLLQEMAAMHERNRQMMNRQACNNIDLMAC